MTDYQQHPLSEMWPAMTDAEFGELRSDIAANGLHFPVILFEGMVLDGWHRFKACNQTGAELEFDEFEGNETDARKFVVSVNLRRRHLNESARALVAQKLANMPPNRPPSDKSANLPTYVSQTEAADLLNVSPRLVGDAKTVVESRLPDLIADVQAGRVSVSKAAKQARAAKPKKTAKPKAKKGGSGKAAQEPTQPQAEIAMRTIEQWNGLSQVEKRAHLEYRNPKASLNPQKTGEDDNAIDWARWTWNPITGCNHNCPYCYARDIAERFSGTSAFPNGFVPTLCPDRLSAPLNGTPRQGDDDERGKRIFTGSMTDLFGRWVPPEWIETVLDVARQAAQWEFLMLTKFPKRMAEFSIPANAWMGTSVDCQARVPAAEAAFERVSAKVRWLSCEPMIEPLKFKHLDRFHLIVIGGASPSSKTPQWIPPFKWLDDLMRQADDAGCAVFLKSNLYRKEAPHGGARYRFMDRAPDVFHYLSRAAGVDQLANAA